MHSAAATNTMPKQSWSIAIYSGAQIARHIHVFAASAEVAWLKGLEQLDDGETLSRRFVEPPKNEPNTPEVLAPGTQFPSLKPLRTAQ